MRGQGAIHHYDVPPRETYTNTPYGTWKREFPGKEISIPIARKWAREVLTGRIAAPVLNDVLLLLSEVVTNAVTHSDSGRTPDGQVMVRVTHSPGDIHVEVTDGGSATSTPTVRMPESDEDGGRGLWLVDLLATAWGSHRGEATGSVWFQVAKC